MARMTLTVDGKVVDKIVVHSAVEQARLRAQGWARADVDRPAQNDKVSAWRDYAVAELGLTPEHADSLTKADLIALAGDDTDDAGAIDGAAGQDVDGSTVDASA